MDLILWRHADALKESDGVADLDRPLSAKGSRQAAAMARWLDHRLPESTRVLVSPTRRTLETAQKLGRKSLSVANLGPGGSAAHLLLAANWPDCRHPVLVVGHQPALGRVASLLLLGKEQDLSVRKCGVVWISSKSRKDVGDADVILGLRAAMSPDLL